MRARVCTVYKVVFFLEFFVRTQSSRTEIHFGHSNLSIISVVNLKLLNNLLLYTAQLIIVRFVRIEIVYCALLLPIIV